MKTITLMDGMKLSAPEEDINISDISFFDDLETECFNLFEQYCSKFGIEKCDFGIDNATAKAIQDVILDILIDAGVNFNFK